MAAAIIINQAGKSAGVAGQAREDLDTGTDVALSASGGPFLAYRWRIVSKPIDITVPVRSAALLTTADASTTLVSPIDLPGTYLVELTVDSGAGLGARDGDVVRKTFYAGPTLAASPYALPRRVPAPFERLEHNVPDALDPAGNTEGWAREMLQRFAVLDRLTQGMGWAGGRVAVSGGVATLGRSYNVDDAVWSSDGVIAVTFVEPMPDDQYSVILTPIDAPAPARMGSGCARNLTVNGFEVRLWDDDSEALADMGFCFRVELGV